MYTHADARALYEATERSRGTLLPWLPWARTDNLSVEACHYTIEKFERDLAKLPAGLIALGVFERASGELVGGSGFHNIKPATHQAEVGYWTRSDWRRKGVCTESTRAVIEWMFRPQSEGGWGFRRIEIKCAAGNVGSQGVPRKLGLREEARFVQDRWIDGRGWDDTLVWGVVQSS